MNIRINNRPAGFSGRTVADLIAQPQPATPFAVAVNTRFIPQSAYADTELKDGDCVDIVRPVVGG